MSKLHIGYYLEKLYDIDKQLGGTAKNNAKKADDFTGLKESIHTKLHALRAYVEQKLAMQEKQRNTDAIKIDMEVKDLISDIETLLNKLNDALRKQAKDKKKYPEQNILAKQKCYANLRQQFFDIQQLLDPNAGISLQSDDSVNDLKSKLMGEDARRPPPPREASREEKEAMERWKQNDQEMDKKFDVILAGTDQWVVNAKKIGSQIDHTMAQIDKLDKEVDKTNAELFKQNESLKKIVEKYRQPNKFCLDIVLVIVLLGLIGIIWVILS